eukprot:SAG31_NODE_50015_length_123_cov_33.333333_1_plen_28_part_10
MTAAPIRYSCVRYERMEHAKLSCPHRAR